MTLQSISKIQKQKLGFIVTGGNRGLGRALVRELAHEGHKVVYTHRSHLQDNINNSYNTLPVRCDVSDKNDVYNLFDKAEAFLGNRIDGLINNAALSGGYGSFTSMADDVLIDIIKTNVTGALLCSKMAIDVFNRQPSMGHIFNITGAGSDGHPTKNFAAYGASKAAMMQFTKSLRAELGNENIGIHLISPGMMSTKLLMNNIPKSMETILEIFSDSPDNVGKWAYPLIINTINNKEKHSMNRYMNVQSIINKAIKASFTLLKKDAQ